MQLSHGITVLRGCTRVFRLFSLSWPRPLRTVESAARGILNGETEWKVIVPDLIPFCSIKNRNNASRHSSSIIFSFQEHSDSWKAWLIWRYLIIIIMKLMPTFRVEESKYSHIKKAVFWSVFCQSIKVLTLNSYHVKEGISTYYHFITLIKYWCKKKT